MNWMSVDLTAITSIATTLVGLLTAYLKNQAAEKVGEKVVEKVGEKAGDALIDTGSRSLLVLRSWFHKKDDTKAEQALRQVVDNPHHLASQQELIQRTVHLAIADATFAQALRTLAEQADSTQFGKVSISNHAPNEGAQGVFNAPVTINNKR